MGFSLNDIPLDDLINEVFEKRCEIEVRVSPDGVEINIRPWEPFHYNCPYHQDT